MSLLTLRKRIDSIDTRIVSLLNQRAALATQIGAEKKKTRSRVYEPSRENQVLARVEAARLAPLDAAGLSRIYKAIMLTMRLLQKPAANQPRKRPAKKR